VDTSGISRLAFERDGMLYEPVKNSARPRAKWARTGRSPQASIGGGAASETAHRSPRGIY
jgi:hypothetical protein